MMDTTCIREEPAEMLEKPYKKAHRESAIMTYLTHRVLTCSLIQQDMYYTYCMPENAPALQHVSSVAVEPVFFKETAGGKTNSNK